MLTITKWRNYVVIKSRGDFDIAQPDDHGFGMCSYYDLLVRKDEWAKWSKQWQGADPEDIAKYGLETYWADDRCREQGQKQGVFRFYYRWD